MSKIQYPTIEEVKVADRVQLCRWVRFLDTPGLSGIDKDNFQEVCAKEQEILNEIVWRYKEAGGMTPQISRCIGW